MFCHWQKRLLVLYLRASTVTLFPFYCQNFIYFNFLNLISFFRFRENADDVLKTNPRTPPTPFPELNWADGEVSGRRNFFPSSLTAVRNKLACPSVANFIRLVKDLRLRQATLHRPGQGMLKGEVSLYS